MHDQFMVAQNFSFRRYLKNVLFDFAAKLLLKTYSGSHYLLNSPCRQLKNYRPLPLYESRNPTQSTIDSLECEKQNMDQDNTKRQKYIHTHMTLQPGVAKEEKPSSLLQCMRD